MKEPYIAIVGVCASGKSTLMEGLAREGIRAHSVPQEHSVVRRLWQRQHPESNILILLDARWETTKQRRPEISYGPERLEDQRQRLAQARAECHLYLPTDDLTVAEVRQRVLDWVRTWKEHA